MSWLAAYREESSSRYKYMRLSPGSALQQQKDYTKFETARKLSFKVEKIRESYRRDMRSEWMKPRQLATALYFIDKLALRVGTEKDPGDGADTVRFESHFCIPLLFVRLVHVRTLLSGRLLLTSSQTRQASLSRQVGGFPLCLPFPSLHLNFPQGTQEYLVELDFLGKDFVHYHQVINVDKLVFKNLVRFKEHKKPDEILFDRINEKDLSAFLATMMPGLTSRVFRTLNASKTFEAELERSATQGDDPEELLETYTKANTVVARLCNHKKSTEAVALAENALLELMEKMADLKEELVEADKALKLAESGGRRARSRALERLYSAKRKMKKAKRALREADVATMEATKSVPEFALRTSRVHYLDPRITVNWCRANQLPIEKVKPNSSSSILHSSYQQLV